MLRPELTEDTRETRALRVWHLAKDVSTQKPVPQMLCANAVILLKLFRDHLPVQGEKHDHRKPHVAASVWLLFTTELQRLPTTPGPSASRLLFPFVGDGPALTMSDF